MTEHKIDNLEGNLNESQGASQSDGCSSVFAAQIIFFLSLISGLAVGLPLFQKLGTPWWVALTFGVIVYLVIFRLLGLGLEKIQTALDAED